MKRKYHSYQPSLPCFHCHPITYIRLVQHLIERCLLLKMDRDECVWALAKHACVHPIVTLTAADNHASCGGVDNRKTKGYMHYSAFVSIAECYVPHVQCLIQNYYRAGGSYWKQSLYSYGVGCGGDYRKKTHNFSKHIISMLLLQDLLSDIFIKHKGLGEGII